MWYLVASATTCWGYRCRFLQLWLMTTASFFYGGREPFFSVYLMGKTGRARCCIRISPPLSRHCYEAELSKWRTWLQEEAHVFSCAAESWGGNKKGSWRCLPSCLPFAGLFRSAAASIQRAPSVSSFFTPSPSFLYRFFFSICSTQLQQLQRVWEKRNQKTELPTSLRHGVFPWYAVLPSLCCRCTQPRYLTNLFSWRRWPLQEYIATLLTHPLFFPLDRTFISANTHTHAHTNKT